MSSVNVKLRCFGPAAPVGPGGQSLDDITPCHGVDQSVVEERSEMPRPERTGVIVLAAQSGASTSRARLESAPSVSAIASSANLGDVPSARGVAHDRRTTSGGRIDAEDIPKAHPSTEMLDVRAELASRAKPSQADVVGLASGRDVSHRAYGVHGQQPLPGEHPVVAMQRDEPRRVHHGADQPAVRRAVELERRERDQLAGSLAHDAGRNESAAPPTPWDETRARIR